jgi:PEGA domain-containing protein
LDVRSQTHMDTATARTPALQRAVFEDAFGKRHHAAAPGGEPLEVLELREEFCSALFESALRERVAALARLQNSCFSRVHSVHRPNQNASKLVVVSDRIPGARLSTVLLVAREQRVPLEVNATLCIIRQLVAAIALLHEKLPTIAHGAIAPDRVVVTPTGRLVVVDHMLGAALEQLHYSADRCWKELRVPLPANAPAFDQHSDVMQIGILALELILGRPVERAEYPDQIDALTEKAWRLATAGATLLPADLRVWLSRTLTLDSQKSFASAVDAWAELERVLDAGDNVASFDALEAFMAEYARAMSATGAPAAAAPSAPVPTPSTPAPASAPVAPAPSTSAKPKRPASVHIFRAADAPASAPSAPSAPPERHVPPVVTYQPAAPIEDEVKSTTPGPNWRLIGAAGVLLALVAGGAWYGRSYFSAPAAAEATGTLVVSTNPAGIPIVIDGLPKGMTPLTLQLAPGPHELKLEGDGEPRIIPLTIAAGSTVSHAIEMPKAGPSTGQLMIRTEPAGARVTVDGTPSGTTPVTLEGLAPGSHTVALANDATSLSQEVKIEAGMTASLVVPLTAPPAPTPASGWVSVTAPSEVQVFEDTRLLGSSQTERIAIGAGSHTLLFVNEALQYRTTRTVTVPSGKVAFVRLDWPMGSMALNAQPWAEVWIDGERAGETPIGNIAVPIGVHEVVFRHPQLGEQSVRATVTVGAPARVSVDMRKR